MCQDQSTPASAYLYHAPTITNFARLHANPMEPRLRADTNKPANMTLLRRVQAADALLTSLGDQGATPTLVYQTQRGPRYMLGSPLPTAALVRRLAAGQG